MWQQPIVQHRMRGLSIVELLIALSVLGIIFGIAAINLRPLSNDVANAATEAAGFFRQVRARAMATTSAYRVVVASNSELRAEYARACSDTAWLPEPRLSLQLREGVTMSGIPAAGGQLICFTSRGLTADNQNPRITLRDRRGNTRQVEVYVGGAVVIHE